MREKLRRTYRSLTSVFFLVLDPTSLIVSVFQIHLLVRTDSMHKVHNFVLCPVPVVPYGTRTSEMKPVSAMGTWEVDRSPPDQYRSETSTYLPRPPGLVYATDTVTKEGCLRQKGLIEIGARSQE